MAISWKFNISEIGSSGNYNISAVVTDDTKPVDYQETTVSIQGRMDDDAQKKANYDALKQQYITKASEADDKAALELDAKTYVEK